MIIRRKNCSSCKHLLPITAFYKDKTTNDGLMYHCRYCDRKIKAMLTKRVKRWKYGRGSYPLRHPKYIADRKELFNNNGNGWWWNPQAPVRRWETE